MTLSELIERSKDMTNFQTIEDYSAFCEEYLTFIVDGLQADVVSRNENHYHFFQYHEDGNYNFTRPINSRLMIPLENFQTAQQQFNYALRHIREIENEHQLRQLINNFIYTCQQSIGATLDALPGGSSNKARKINGELFERYIRLILNDLGIAVRKGTVSVPIIVNGTELFKMAYQHDLIVEENGAVKAIGSVKTSSKDRIDKVFTDKFLYNHLTNATTPHFAVFLNDVQRKGREPHFGINTTFLTGHFKGYTIKLNSLDGVYYCDLRPNMSTDDILSTQIHSLDRLLIQDIWNFIK